MSRFAQASSFLFADDPLSEEPSGYGPHNASLNAALLRVDPLGVVHYDKPATGLGGNTFNSHHGSSTISKKNKTPVGGVSDSDDEDGAGVKPVGSTLGGLYRSITAAAHNPLRPQNNTTISKTPKLICEPVPFLRPKVLPKSVTDARRFAPPGLCHSSAVGFESEDIIILFGGALQDTVQPTNDTWMYQVSDRRWNRLDTLEIATEALQQVRRRRGLSGDILPAPRSGHCAVAIRDTVLDQPIALQFKSRKAAKSDALTYAPNDPFAPALTDSAVDSSLLFPSSTNNTPYSPLKGGNKQPFSPVNHNVGGPSDPDQWSYRPSMLVFGGSNVSLGATYNDLWLFDVQCRAWKELSPLGTPPTPRWKCTGAALEQRMFIFGGETSSFDIVNELHMYDHISGMWRELRVVEPCPRPRLGHGCAVVGHKMIIAGGLDKQSYLDHVALMLQTASGNNTNTTSRKASLTMSSQQHHKNSDLDSISDVWCLDMRTLLWRELATQDKKNSPFAVISAPAPGRPHHKPSSRRQSGQSDQLGRMRASSMSPARRESIAAPHAEGVTFGCMEGHVLLPFDDSVIVHGGTLNGKLNTRIFSLNVANEYWSFHGEINTTSANSTNKLLKAQRALQAGAEPEDPMAIITSGMERKPQPRAQHAGCAFVSKMALQSLGNFAALGNVSLSTGLTPGTFSTATSTVPTLGGGSTSASVGVSQHTVHMSQPKETGPLIAQLAVPLAQQVSTRGLVTVYKNKPVVHKTTHVFFFGGMSFPRSVSDMWCLKLDIPISHQNVDDSDHTIGDRILAASKAGIVGNITNTSSVLGDKLLKMKPMGLGGSDARATTTREEDGTFARSQREPAPEYYFPALAIKNEEDLEVERLAHEAKLKSLDQTVASGAGDPGSPTKKVGFAPPAVEVRTPPRSHVNSPTSEKAFQSESSSSDSDDEARTAEESARRESERMRRRMATLREQIVNDAQAYILGTHHRPIHRSTGGSH